MDGNVNSHEAVSRADALARNPMTPERREEIRARCYVPICDDEDHMVVRELLAEVDRLARNERTLLDECAGLRRELAAARERLAGQAVAA